MGLFNKLKKTAKQTQQEHLKPQPKVTAGKTEVVVTIPNAKVVSGSKYFQDAMRTIQGDSVQVAIVDREKTQLQYDDYAVVLMDMTPVGTLSQYGFDKLGLSEGEVVNAIVQRPPADGLIRLWIPMER